MGEAETRPEIQRLVGGSTQQPNNYRYYTFLQLCTSVARHIKMRPPLHARPTTNKQRMRTYTFSFALPQPLKAGDSARVVFGAWLLSKTGKLWPGTLRCVRPRAPHDQQAKNAYISPPTLPTNNFDSIFVFFMIIQKFNSDSNVYSLRFFVCFRRECHSF